MQNYRIAIFLTAALVVGAGCKKEQPVATAPPVTASPAAAKPSTPAQPVKPKLSDDPAASFEDFSMQFVARARALMASTNKPTASWLWTGNDQFKVDVKKTDSVMSPFTGVVVSTISYSEQLDAQRQATLGRDIFITMNLTVTFAAQHGKWVLTDVQAINTRPPNSDLGENVRPVLEQAASSVPQ